MRNRLREKLAVVHLEALQHTWGLRPVSMRYWLAWRRALRRVSGPADSLFPSYSYLTSPGGSLAPQELRRLLSEDELGAWSLDRETLEFLWRKMRQDRPKVIVECGAGISTLVLAAHASLEDPTGGCQVLSIEQDAETKRSVENRLARHGLSAYARVLHAPLSDRGNYDLDKSDLENLMRGVPADWLLIDGPAGPDGCRIDTLPALARFCRPEARWFLDDAFRDGEISVLVQWGAFPGVVVDGIYPLGKGLATGIVQDPLEATEFKRRRDEGLAVQRSMP